MDLIAQVRQNAAAKKRVIVLPEGVEDRTILATTDVVSHGLASPILLEKKLPLQLGFKELGVNPEQFQIIDPETSAQLTKYVNIYREMRAQKRQTGSRRRSPEHHERPALLWGYDGTPGEAAGSLAGAINATGKGLRPPRA